MAFSISAWRTMCIGLQFEHLPVPVGDEAVIAVGGRRGFSWEPGVGFFTPDDELAPASASGSDSRKGVQVVSGLHRRCAVHPCRE